MFAIVGLGNPGKKYGQTRHNAGFLVIEKLSSKLGIALDQKGFDCRFGKGRCEGNEILLAQPQTFMNLSGRAVLALVQFYKISPEKVLIIYDDMDLPIGALRLRKSGSAGGHKGLTSVVELLGTQGIPRLRVGIGRPENDQAVIDYVLTPFTATEQPVIGDCIGRAAEAAAAFVGKGPDFVMNHYNTVIARSTDG